MDTENPILEEDDDAFLASLNALLGDEPVEAEEEPPAPPEPPKKRPEKQQMPRHAKKRPPKPSKKAAAITGILAGAAVVCALAVPAILRAMDPYGGKIAPGVTVGTVDLSGLSKSEAKKALADYYCDSEKDMVVSFPGVASILDGTGEGDSFLTLTLSSNETGARLDAGEAVQEAYAVGRKSDITANQLTLLPYLHLDQTALYTAAETYAQSLKALSRADSYEVQEMAPDVSPEKWNENTPCQSVLLTRGYPAIEIDADQLFRQLLSAYEAQTFALDYDGDVTVTQPEAVDLDALWQQTRLAAVEPSVDLTTYQVVPGRHGYEFDLDEAKTQWANVPYGGELALQLHYTAPQTADEDAYFQDTLGYCETPHGNNENRNSNLRKACEMLNGLVLQPGQEFSYNETLGERTKEKGWLPAPAYSGVTLVDSPGGGICQVSSTLYLASVYAELTILERVNHGYPVSYIPLGMDATVNWGFTDLKMRNDTPMPVKILAEESDGYVRVSILGTETRDYTVEMSYSVGGRHVKTYMSKYDKTTGELISKEPVALSSYLEDIYK